MRVLIDIGHPAHVHFYKNFIARMKDSCEFIITARDKDITLQLLDLYNLKYFYRGRGASNGIGRMLYLPKAVSFIGKLVRQYKIDILTGINNPYISLAAFINGKKSYIFNDTEHARVSVILAKMFCSTLFTPNSYFINEGRKQVRYDGFHELAYLHPDYFTPDASVLKPLRLRGDEKYVVMRFVSWEASHDAGYRGLSLEMKRRAVASLSRVARVFITSEAALPHDLEKYHIPLSADKIHHVLYYASLYFGDGGTMASEAAVLGTPAVNVSAFARRIGTFAELAKYQLMYLERDEKSAIELCRSLLSENSLKQKAQSRRRQLLKEKIDVTNFLVSVFKGNR